MHASLFAVCSSCALRLTSHLVPHAMRLCPVLLATSSYCIAQTAPHCAALPSDGECELSRFLQAREWKVPQAFKLYRCGSP